MRDLTFRLATRIVARCGCVRWGESMFGMDCGLVGLGRLR